MHRKFEIHGRMCLQHSTAVGCPVQSQVASTILLGMACTHNTTVNRVRFALWQPLKNCKALWRVVVIC